MEITQHKIHQNFNIQHLIKFCMVYNTIINYYDIPHVEVNLYNDKGAIILKRLSKIILHNEIPAKIKNELIQLDNIAINTLSGFTLKQMKIINVVYKSLIKKDVIPSKSYPEFMRKSNVYNQWLCKNKSKK